MSTRSPRQIAITVGQYAVALVALWWLAEQIDIASAARRLFGLEPAVIAVLLGISLLGAVAQFGTWAAVFKPIQRVSVRSVASISLVVNFVNQLLPSRLSGRLAAPFVIRSATGMKYADAAAASGVHTGIYAVLYGVVSTGGLLALWLLESPSLGLGVILAVSTGLYLVAGSVVLVAGTNLSILDPLLELIASVLRPLPRIGDPLATWVEGLTDFTEASTEAFRSLASNRRVWLNYAASWAIVLLLAPAIRVGLLLAAFGVSFEPTAVLPFYILTAYSVTLLPISPGGVGITEATATAVFVMLGVPSDVIVPIVFVDRVLGIYLPAVIGWVPAARLDLSRLRTD